MLLPLAAPVGPDLRLHSLPLRGRDPLELPPAILTRAVVRRAEPFVVLSAHLLSVAGSRELLGKRRFVVEVDSHIMSAFGAEICPLNPLATRWYCSEAMASAGR